MGITCSVCRQDKDINDFRKASNKRGFRYSCKFCDRDKENVKRARMKKENPALLKQIEREEKLRSNYGMSLSAYNEMLVSQNGVCAICKNQCVSGRSLAVDHDHNTGNIRGLLCCNCNRGIGLLQDNPAYLQAALDYLKA